MSEIMIASWHQIMKAVVLINEGNSGMKEESKSSTHRQQQNQHRKGVSIRHEGGISRKWKYQHQKQIMDKCHGENNDVMSKIIEMISSVAIEKWKAIFEGESRKWRRHRRYRNDERNGEMVIELARNAIMPQQYQKRRRRKKAYESERK